MESSMTSISIRLIFFLAACAFFVVWSAPCRAAAIPVQVLVEFGISAGLGATADYLSDPQSPCFSGRYGNHQANNTARQAILGGGGGAVVGAAMGGDLKSTLKGALWGAAAGKVLSLRNHKYLSDAAKRDEHVCEMLRSSKMLMEPLIAQFGDTYRQACGVDEQQISSDSIKAFRQIQACTQRNASLAPQFSKDATEVYKQNHQTCLAIAAYLRQWDRAQAKKAEASGQSFMPTLNPEQNPDGSYCP